MIDTIRELTPIDPSHPTRVLVRRHPEDRSDMRTDKRPRECYHAQAEGEVGDILTLDFHEGGHPKDGLSGWLVEDLLDVLLDRMNQHQSGPFRSRHNALAITALEQARCWLFARRREREMRGVSGTQTP